jgi:hypothetical protein
VHVRHSPGPVDGVDADGRPRVESRTLAERVEVADTALAKARGLMLRRLPADGALVFSFGVARARTVHTLLVPAPIDVVWTVGGEVVRVETMRAWFDLARATADRLIELPAGAADGVDPGDTLAVEGLTDAE